MNYYTYQGIIMGQSNPGIGAIVGSAMFNILFVVGLCGLFVMGVSFSNKNLEIFYFKCKHIIKIKMKIKSAKLTMWPFFRDAVFYCIAILLLVLVSYL